MDVDEFMRDRYLVVRDAFDADVVAARRDAIWAHLAAYGVRPDDPGRWRRPATPDQRPGGEPFAAGSPTKHSAHHRSG